MRGGPCSLPGGWLQSRVLHRIFRTEEHDVESIRYISTRGRTEPMGFQDAVLTGLAPDGGLLIPEHFPGIGERLHQWHGISYQDLAYEIIRLYADIPDADLRPLIDRAYARFRDPAVAPVTPAGDLQVLELFHGPTLAFKDFALQFLGNVFEYILERRDERLNILAATSGDTGSAAIDGVRGQPRIRIFVMHPRGRVAMLQERQMTTVLDDNVFNLAVDGTFDDCQQMMKSLFGDVAFKDRYRLGAVNSVNWARVLAQIVYYVYAGIRQLEQGADSVSFSVPTGNFGDILAGYYARRMGLPIRRLVLAANENDILARFFNTGEYRRSDVVKTLSPSMDIQVASNFERYLYHKVDDDPADVRRLMAEFQESGVIAVPLAEPGHVDPVFRAGVGNREATLQCIARYWREHNVLLDPHTAVGVHVAESHREQGVPMVCLATAHPAKFPDAIREATGEDLAHHEILDRIKHLPTRSDPLAGDEGALRAYLEGHID